MIPSFLAFISEAIQVTGMNSYFLCKFPFTVLLTLVQHLFPDFVTCAWKCLKQPDKAVIIRCILLDSSGFSPRLPHFLSFGQMCTPARLVHRFCASEHRPPTWQSGCVWLCSGPFRFPLARCHPTPSILASPEWKCQWDPLLCSWFHDIPFWHFQAMQREKWDCSLIA